MLLDTPCVDAKNFSSERRNNANFIENFSDTLQNGSAISHQNDHLLGDKGCNEKWNTGTVEKIHNIKKKHVKNVTIGYININSIRNKFDDLKILLKDSLDILIVAETKIDA